MKDVVRTAMSNGGLVHTGPAVPLKVLPSAERGGAVGALIAAKAAIARGLARHMVMGHGGRFEAKVRYAAAGRMYRRPVVDGWMDGFVKQQQGRGRNGPSQASSPIISVQSDVGPDWVTIVTLRYHPAGALNRRSMALAVARFPPTRAAGAFGLSMSLAVDQIMAAAPRVACEPRLLLPSSSLLNRTLLTGAVR